MRGAELTQATHAPDLAGEVIDLAKGVAPVPPPGFMAPVEDARDLLGHRGLLRHVQHLGRHVFYWRGWSGSLTSVMKGRRAAAILLWLAASSCLLSVVGGRKGVNQSRVWGLRIGRDCVRAASRQTRFGEEQCP